MSSNACIYILTAIQTTDESHLWQIAISLIKHLGINHVFTMLQITIEIKIRYFQNHNRIYTTT